MNKVIAIGNLGKDPEIKMTTSGKSVATFSLATKVWSAQGDQTEWLNCVAWERIAQLSADYLKKGSLVYIEGVMKTRSWEDADGKKSYKTEITVREIKFLSSKKSENNYSEPSNTPTSTDDLPF